MLGNRRSRLSGDAAQSFYTSNPAESHPCARLNASLHATLRSRLPANCTTSFTKCTIMTTNTCIPGFGRKVGSGRRTHLASRLTVCRQSSVPVFCALLCCKVGSPSHLASHWRHIWHACGRHHCLQKHSFVSCRHVAALSIPVPFQFRGPVSGPTGDVRVVHMFFRRWLTWSNIAW